MENEFRKEKYGAPDKEKEGGRRRVRIKCGERALCTWVTTCHHHSKFPLSLSLSLSLSLVVNPTGRTARHIFNFLSLHSSGDAAITDASGALTSLSLSLPACLCVSVSLYLSITNGVVVNLPRVEPLHNVIDTHLSLFLSISLSWLVPSWPSLHPPHDQFNQC